MTNMASGSFETVLAGSPETIISHVFSAQVPPPKLEQLAGLEDYYGEGIDKVWSGAEPPDYVEPSFREPKYIESADPSNYQDKDSFRNAMYVEYRGRAEEQIYWRAFGELVRHVENPDDYIKLIDAFDFIFENSRHAEDVFTPASSGLSDHRSLGSACC